MPSTYPNVISFSLWGSDKAYINGLYANIIAASQYYPNFKVVVFVHCDTLNYLKTLSMPGVDCIFYPVSLKPSWSGMFWRMLPILWPHSQYVLVRDLDSRLTLRESLAVNEWIASGLPFHIMRDHPFHAAPIMGGMFGADARSPLVKLAFKGVKNLILQSQYADENEYWQVDQDYLATKVYPAICQHAFVHDPFFARRDFPAPRIGLDFVGQAFDRSSDHCSSDQGYCDETEISLKAVLGFIDCQKFLENRFGIFSLPE